MHVERTMKQGRIEESREYMVVGGGCECIDQRVTLVGQCSESMIVDWRENGRLLVFAS